jgi:nucleoside-diphosphate-sugar epimerase
VEGTRNIVASSLRHGVKRIVFTSSPSVVFTGDHMTNADETLPYSTHFEAAYPRTKTESEQLILAANSDDLAIVSLRPHLVWGPGDNNLLPRIISRAKAGRLIKIGLGERLIDPVYIENAIDAHLEAAFRLDPGSPIAGKSYFITQGETIPIWTMINHMLAAAHLPPVKRAVPRPVAVAVSGVIEGYYHLTRRKDEPPMTRFMARQLSTTHWFNIAAARRDLGYEPRVSFAEGLRRLEAWLSAEGSKMGGPV